ncbi:AzlD domain-containing protein [Spirochaeta dissipatitropha]
MNSTDVWIVIAGMAVGTYLVRVLPFLVRVTDKLPPRGQRLLAAIPPAALGALLVPGALEAVPSNPLAGLAAAGLAFIIGLKSRHILIPVAASIFLVYWFI